MRKDVYSRHIKNYQTHWWFKARKNIIHEILKNSIKKKRYKILDFGAGSGTNINMLANFGFVYLYEKDKKIILSSPNIILGLTSEYKEPSDYAVKGKVLMKQLETLVDILKEIKDSSFDNLTNSSK